MVEEGTLLTYGLLRKKDTNKELKNKEGLVVVKTKQAVLLAHHPDGVQTNNCVNTVEALADYLIGVGY